MTARRIGFTGEGLRRAAPPRRTQKGVGLLEVLIAVVIVAIGLLGLAGLQTVSLQLNQGALVRSQASNLAYDITERIRANWADAAAYSIGLDDDPEASPSTLAAADVKEWRDALAATLPDGTGSVNVAGNRVIVVIRWLDADDQDGGFERNTERSFEFRTDL